LASMASRGRMRSSQPGRAQLAGPVRCMMAGTSRRRISGGVRPARQPEAEAELLQDPLAPQKERPEDHDHDSDRGRDDRAAPGLADGDRQVIVPGGPPAEGGQLTGLGVVQVVPLLLDPADQVYLVVHGQAEEHGEHDHRDEGVDRSRPGTAEGRAAPAPG
jgi:hypothetical protein